LTACAAGVELGEGVGVDVGGVGVAGVPVADGVGVAVGGVAVGVGLGLTVVSSVSELLSGVGSSKSGTEAVFESVPPVVGVTTKLTVALAPATIKPRSQTTVLVPVQLPWLGVAETKFTPAGK
jgi:hypothetical protein